MFFRVNYIFFEYIFKKFKYENILREIGYVDVKLKVERMKYF